MDEAGSKTKKHKRKHKYDIEKMEEAELCKTEKVIVEPNECISPVGEKKKKKKKKKKSKDEESEGDKIENEPDIVKAVCNKRKVSEIGNGHDEEKPEKKRKRKDQETERDLESQNNVSIDSKNASADIQDYTNIKSKKKKKSKKSKMVSEMDIEEGIIENADAVKQNEENNKHLPDIKNGKEKKKHKKKKKHMSESDELSEKGETNGSTDEILCQAVKKKKKKR